MADSLKEDYEFLVLGLRNIMRRYDERPMRYTKDSLLEDLRWMINDADRRQRAKTD